MRTHRHILALLARCLVVVGLCGLGTISLCGCQEAPPVETPDNGDPTGGGDGSVDGSDSGDGGDSGDGSDSVPFVSGENKRVALQSGCAQTVLACTTQQPVVFLDVLPGEGQFVTETDTGFVIVGSNPDGSEVLRFRGSRSVAGRSGVGLNYSWSAGATDDNPTTLAPGERFSTKADTTLRLGVGFHYVRLTVRHDDVPLGVPSTNDLEMSFVEVEIEVRFSEGSDFFESKRWPTD